MAVVTFSGAFVDTENAPLYDELVKIYKPSGLFAKFTQISVRTGPNGEYQFPLKSSKGAKCYQLCLTNSATGELLFDKVFKVEPGMTEVDLGTKQISLYATKEGLPLEINGEEHAKLLAEENRGFFAELLRNGTVPKIKQLFAHIAAPFVTTPMVQFAYTHFDQKPLNDESVCDMLFNGLFPAIPLQRGSNSELVYSISFENCEQDGSADLPDAEIVLKKTKQGYEIKEAAVRYPKEDWEGAEKGSADYERFLHLAVSMAAVQGEAVHHLGIGHLMCGLYSQAFLRFIRNNPILNLLKAHLSKATLRINNLGEDLIFGNGVLNVSGLSAKGIEQLIATHLAAVDYTHYEPRKSKNKQQTFAAALNHYWSHVVKPVVEQFFETHREEICAHWQEIYLMSKKLTNKSVDFDLAPQNPGYEQNHEIDLDPEGRVEVNGKVKSFRPITQKKSDPEEADLERLKQWCCHAILLSTLWHTQLHNSQRKFVSDLRFATLAPQNKGLNNDGTRNLYLNTKSQDGAQQLAVVGTLTGFEAPKLLVDPLVLPELKTSLEENRQIFAQIGFNINDIMSTVAI